MPLRSSSVSGRGIQQMGFANNPAASSAMFYDSSVKVKDSGTELYPVSVMVSVFPLREPVTPANWSEAWTQVETNVIPQLKSPGLTVSPLADTTLAGRPALTSTLTQKAPGIPVTTTLTFVFDGSNEYQVAKQAPMSDSKKMDPALDKMVESLTLPGSWPSETPSTSSTPSASS